MAISFDAAAKRINLSSGTVTLNVVDLYSRWKDWVREDDNMKYDPAFAVVGGDDIDLTAGTAVPCYAFLLNGWRIKPQEANHTLSVSGGVVLVSGGGDPFVNTIGNFIVRINYQQPVQAITVNTAGGAGATPAEIAAAVRSELTTELARIDLAISTRASDARAIDIQSQTDMIPIMIGLMKHNYRMTNIVHSAGKPVSALIKVYASAEDCNNDIDPIAQLNVTSEYIGDLLSDYRSVRV